MLRKDIYVGTSGWNYYSFREVFYPSYLKSKEWLAFYATHFNTVEVNATFYKLPTLKTFEKWYKETPKEFIFSLKAPKVITHIKRLKEVNSELKEFLTQISALKEKALVLLFQLPPSLKYEAQVLKEFLKILPQDYLKVLEIRHQSFHCEEFVELLREYKVGLCFSDCAGRYPSWYEVQTTDFLYFRMHGSKKLYVSNYEEEELRVLVQKINLYSVKRAFIYFDNTFLGYAILNAKRLKELIEEVK